MRKDVFIAYSRKDSWAAEAVEHCLHEGGLKCYRDVKNIPGSAKWMEEITEGIDRCHTVGLVVSKSSARSRHVKCEVAIAVEANKTFVPIWLSDDVKLPGWMRYPVSGHQRMYITKTHEKTLHPVFAAVRRAVDQSKHKEAYTDLEDVRERNNYSREINFSEDRCGLYVGEAIAGVTTVESSAYIMKAKPDGYLGLEISMLPPINEFIIESRIVKLDGPNDQWFGFEFGQRYPGNYFQFLLCGRGTVRISKHWNKEWRDLACHEGLSHILHGNAENVLKVVRKDLAIHVFINELHALSAKDWDVRLGGLGLVVGKGVSAAFSDLNIEGVDLDKVFMKAMSHWDNLEMKEAKTLLEYVVKYDPAYKSDKHPKNAGHALVEPRPDRRKSILIVIGYQILPQIHDGVPAAKLRDVINRKGNRDNFEFASIITDNGLLEENTYMQCPMISIGGSMFNNIAGSFIHELPLDPVSAEHVRIQHDIDKKDTRAALWGGGCHETVEAVDLFISSGLLDRFLSMIWEREISK